MSELNESAYFSQGSADEILANQLRHARSCSSTAHVAGRRLTGAVRSCHSDGDVLLINRRCMSLPLPQAMLCLASKYGLSGTGYRCWDHAAVVLRDHSSGVPYVLEGDTAGVRLRSYEERLLQAQDHQVAFH